MPGRNLHLPVRAVILAILGGATALLVGGCSKPALPGKANAAKVGSFQGLVLNPRVPAPALDTLRNYDGTSFNLAAERGKAVFVTFLYAHCPDVCPLIASNLHNAYARMTPAMRRAWRSSRSRWTRTATPRAPSPRSCAARADGRGPLPDRLRQEAGAVWEAWKVGSQADASNPGLVNHSALIYGVSASGKLTTIYPANFEPSQIIHDVPGLLGS